MMVFSAKQLALSGIWVHLIDDFVDNFRLSAVIPYLCADDAGGLISFGKHRALCGKQQ
jgi:hypothetical protein